MSRPRPMIVVTLPARTVDDAVRQVGTAREGGADAAELRVDRLAPSERQGIARLFPSPFPLIATYRSTAEGGEGEDDPSTRRPVLLELAAQPFRWIDLELRRDLGLLPHLPPIDRLGRIVSCHPGSVPSSVWTERLHELEAVDGIGKLVVPATVGEALREIVPQAARQDEEMVLLTTGPSGPLLRVWARRFGFPLVYAALPEAANATPVEPSQIGVDVLRRYLEREEAPPLFAVCGRPVGYSRSPAIHAAWMREEGRDGLYVALEFADDREFLDALGPLADGGFRGLNVTQPFKSIAAEVATEIGPGARACGAANCLTFADNGIAAENTDLLAMLRRLEELRSEGRWDGRALSVIGSGGAARATLAAARELGATATVYARRPMAAGELAQRFGARVAAPDDGPPATLLVHATAVGRVEGEALDVPLAPLLGEGSYLLDWVYSPSSPVVRRAAEAASATYEDGWRLLVYQAAASYEIWWGRAPADASIARTVAEGPCAA
jgi:shikimate dehydrogenase/3-dehydroquinate dehydratase type I